MTIKLVDVEQWCDNCGEMGVDKVLVDGGEILGYYCDPCGEQELESIAEREKPRAHCHFNYNTNRPCLLDDKHTGDHDLPCVGASAHEAHAKGGAAADGTLYQCRGRRFDRT